MPFCKCPRCGNVSHLHLKISRYEWYRRFFPTHDPRQPAPAICARCWTREHGLEVVVDGTHPLSQSLPAIATGTLPAESSDVASAR